MMGQRRINSRDAAELDGPLMELSCPGTGREDGGGSELV